MRTAATAALVSLWKIVMVVEAMIVVVEFSQAIFEVESPQARVPDTALK